MEVSQVLLINIYWAMIKTTYQNKDESEIMAKLADELFEILCPNQNKSMV